MSRRVEVRPANWLDVDELAGRMRHADVEEIWAAAHLTPAAALESGLRVSTGVWTGLVNDRVVCMFGVNPVSLVRGVGAPWLLGSDLVDDYQITFLRHCRPIVQQMNSMYPVLVNHVDDRNEAAKRWLGWLGFRLDEPRPHGVEKMPFRRFTMGVENV